MRRKKKNLDWIEDEQISIVFGSLFGEPKPMFEDTLEKNTLKEQEEC